MTTTPTPSAMEKLEAWGALPDHGVDICRTRKGWTVLLRDRTTEPGSWYHSRNDSLEAAILTALKIAKAEGK